MCENEIDRERERVSAIDVREREQILGRFKMGEMEPRLEYQTALPTKVLMYL